MSIGSYTGSSLIEALNSVSNYNELDGYSRWILNRNDKTVSFKVNGANSFNVNSKIILLPDVENGGKRCFDGWHVNDACTTLLSKNEIDSDTELYGVLRENSNRYTIIFDTRGGTLIESIISEFNSVIDLPNDSRKNYCSLGFWETDQGYKVPWNFAVPDHNITLHAVWGCTHINNAEDFIGFSKVVSSGSFNYSGTTVLLDSDIDFSGDFSRKIEPIGKDNSNYFLGTFDGQGHTISNLTMNYSYSQYLGLFGYSEGLTIKCVIIDESSSFMKLTVHGNYDNYAGSIIGLCSMDHGKCIIENCVNMADITSRGSIKGRFLYMGGIAGGLSSTNNDSIIRNCANYGSILNSGENGGLSIGGITGHTSVSSIWKVYVQNCLNYGGINFSGKISMTFYLGGIIGYGQNSSIDNCVSAGSISTSKTGDSIGSFVGCLYSVFTISNSYWTNDIGYNNAFGSGNPTTFEESTQVAPSLEIVKKLNSYSSTNSWNKWLFNTNSLPVTFKISKWKGFTVKSQIIIVPDFVSDTKRLFSGWYSDESLTIPFTSSEIVSNTAMYGGWIIDVRFDGNGGIISSLSTKTTIKCADYYGEFPNVTRTGYTFCGWFTTRDGGWKAESRGKLSYLTNHTLYAHWSINNYTITLDTKREIYIESITSEFNSTIELPKNAGRDNCVVSFWENEDGEIMAWKFTTPAYNMKLHATWNCTLIRSAADLVDFSKIVNSGISNFKETTMYLDSDIAFTEELSQQFKPIGNGNNYFIGSFDGQGHVISNLSIKSAITYIGLFGYSGGSRIRNVVMDSSCSVLSSYNSGSGAFIGSIIGACASCVVESSINMGNVTFNGRASVNFFIGGIAGYLTSSGTVFNCGNYGPVTYSGTYSKYSYIGGITGVCINNPTNSILNCVNHGTITHRGTSDSMLLGGIVGDGYSGNVVVENCVSAGSIVTATKGSKENYLGSIVGYNYGANTKITHCLWTSDVGYSKAYSGRSVTVTSTSLITVDERTVEELNEYAGKNNSFNKWVFNSNENPITFKVNDYDGFDLASKLILLPDLADSIRRRFSGWFIDDKYEILFNSSTISERMTLYGLYETMIVITFDGNGGIPQKESKGTFDDVYGELPNATRGGHTFSGWFTEKECGEGEEATENTTIPMYDHTLYAHWTASNYTITFECRGGTPSLDPITEPYGSVILLPSTPRREHCDLGHWENEDGERVEWNFTVPARNTSLRAVWSCTLIRSADDLVDFSKVVNCGSSELNGRTVYLDTDIAFTEELSQRFEPIGNSFKNYFTGTFDGQGHAISNLALNSSSMFTGLFGYSNNLDIQNVVLDEFCSVINSFNLSDFFIGSIIGYLYGK